MRLGIFSYVGSKASGNESAHVIMKTGKLQICSVGQQAGDLGKLEVETSLQVVCWRIPSCWSWGGRLVFLFYLGLPLIG